MWSARITSSLKAAGYETVVYEGKGDLPEAEVAVVSMGAGRFSATDVVRGLVSKGVKVAGHAGHSEKELQKVGREAGCSMMVTNSYLATNAVDVVAGLVKGT